MSKAEGCHGWVEHHWSRQSTHQLCAAIKGNTATRVKYWADSLRRLASFRMKNVEMHGKQGSWVRGETSSSTGECVCVCVNPPPPIYLCGGAGAKADAMSEIDTTFHLLRQIGSGNRNTWIYALLPTSRAGGLMGSGWLRTLSTLPGSLTPAVFST
jgi:hypothetical protein